MSNEPAEVVIEEVTEVVEDVAEVVEPQTVSMEDVETAAREQGWSPDKGDLNALDFLAKGRDFRNRLFDEVKELRNENEKLYSSVAERFDKQDRQEHAAHTQSLEEQIDEAVEAGDVEKVKQLRSQIQPAPQSTATDPNQEFVSKWMDDNKWFNDDPSMQKTARGLLQAELIADGMVQNPATQLPSVLEQMKKIYPDKFKVPKNPNEERGTGAEKSGTLTKSKKKGLQRSDLTEDESRHLDAFVDQGMDEKKLLASIQRERSRRG